MEVLTGLPTWRWSKGMGTGDPAKLGINFRPDAAATGCLGTLVVDVGVRGGAS